MPEVTAANSRQPRYSIWLNGPAGSGKTRAALGFPKVLAVTFDPTGLDIIYEPENEKIRENLVWHCPMNGLALSDVFRVEERASEDSLHGAIHLAKNLAKEKKVETILIDGFTYLASLKWDHICQDEQIETRKGGLDTQKMYARLSTYLNQFVIQNLLPLAVRSGLNIIVTCHVQRENKATVEGVNNPNDPGFERTKRQVNLESDLNPQVIGGFRQAVEGLPSALIYLDHKVETATEADVKAGRAKTAGAEILNYYAYCRKTFVKSLDSQVNAKNRYGLPTILKLTGGNLYKTLLSKLPADDSNPQPPANATQTAKGAN